MKSHNPLLITALLILTSSCSTPPKTEPPFTEIRKITPPTPSQWQATALQNQAEPQAWLEDFQDDILSDLVTEALANNLGLRTISARIKAAQAQVKTSSANLLPSVNTDAGISRSKNSASSTTNRFQANTRFNWELDLWGKLDDKQQAAAYEVSARQADYRAAQLALAANIARNWFNLLTAQAQEALAFEQHNSFQQSLQAIEERYRRGLTAALDVRLARENVASAAANLQLRKRNLDTQQRSLETLLGRYPAAEIQAIGALPKLRRDIPIGLPAHLLSRRPDIIAAEQRLQASIAQQQSSHKNHLPNIQLSANAGTASSALRNLLSLDQLIWSIGSSLTHTIFDGGSREAEREQRQAEREEAIARYAEAVLIAFQEVETTLAAEPLLTTQERNRQNAVTESDKARQLAFSQYRSGLVEILTLLDSQRRYFNSRSQLLDVQQQRLQNRINLYLALAGSY